MNLKEFHDWLKYQPLKDKLVKIRYKYSTEYVWTTSKEYLEVDVKSYGYYAWLDDWYEGQEDVEILGCVNVSDICTFI